MNDLLRKYIDLFNGRTDCYGGWEGACIRKPVTVDLFREHLNGNTQIGIYPTFTRGDMTMSHWGCTDIDVDDYDAARRIHDAFAMKDITTWVERTRKGYHVWLFPTRPVESVIMRNAFLVVHKVADVPATEVNPKQTHLAEGKVGNYVRLPYPNDGSGLRYMMYEDKSKIDLSDFVEDAHSTKVQPTQLAQLAVMWKPEPKHAPQKFALPSNHSVPHDRLGRVTRWLIRNGVVDDNKDRSSQLFRVACLCFEDGLSPTEVMSVLYDCDHRWGKYANRHDQEAILSKIVESAMSKSGGGLWHEGSQTRSHSP